MSEQSWEDVPLPYADTTWGPAPTPAPAVTEQATTLVKASHVSEELAEATSAAVAFYRHPDEVSRLAGELGRRLTDLVHSAHGEVRERRPEGKVTAEVVAPELRVLADAATTLDVLGKALTAAAKLARDVAGEVVLEVRPDDEMRTATTKVADGHGRSLRVTRSQATEVSAKPEEIVDVLVPWLMDEGEGEATHAAGVREGIAAWRALVGPPKWKSTALDALARKMDDAGEHALALRLGHAYGRVPTGNPRTSIDRVEEK